MRLSTFWIAKRYAKLPPAVQSSLTRQFSLLYTLPDPMTWTGPCDNIFAEQSGQYYRVPKDTCEFPFTFSSQHSTRAVGSIAFNEQGNLMAVIDTGLPNIVWIWNITNGFPSFFGCLIQTSPIRQLLWCPNPNTPNILMTTNEDPKPVLHQWVLGQLPKVVCVPAAPGGRHSAAWLRAYVHQGLILFSHQNGYILGYIDRSDSEASLVPVDDARNDENGRLHSGFASIA